MIGVSGAILARDPREEVIMDVVVKTPTATYTGQWGGGNSGVHVPGVGTFY
jgi:hypothetical protein